MGFTVEQAVKRAIMNHAKRAQMIDLMKEYSEYIVGGAKEHNVYLL